MSRLIPLTLFCSTLLCLPSLGAKPHGPLGWARGDLHQHTEFSDDGAWEVEKLWEKVRETLPVGARFTIATDHNDIAGFFPNPARPPKADNFRSWGPIREVRRSLKPNELFLAGQELGGLRGGHVGAVLLPQENGEQPPTLITETGFRHADWMKRTHEVGGLNVVYHPRGVDELGPIHPGTFTKWEECIEHIDMISVWNGYKNYDEPDRAAWDRIWRYWSLGKKIVAVGGSDAHHQVHKGRVVPFWGIDESGVGFHGHPMNPHNRVKLTDGEPIQSLSAQGLKEGFLSGAVTVVDWPENWMNVSFTGTSSEGEAASKTVGIGQEVTVRAGDALTYQVEGYGAPESYSSEPILFVEYHRVQASQPGEKVKKVTPFVLEIPLPKGDFSVAQELRLEPGDWAIAARILPVMTPSKAWRGVQIANPIWVHVR